MPPSTSTKGATRVHQDSRTQQILSAQVRLLYANTKVGVTVTIFAATILAYLQWGVVPHLVVLGWWFYMILVSVSRFPLAQRYRHASPGYAGISKWRTAFAVGAGLAGAGWGGAGILLYPEAHLANQVFLLFVLGGMMIGAASLLAPRPEAFLAFLIPTGFAPGRRVTARSGSCSAGTSGTPKGRGSPRC